MYVHGWLAHLHHLRLSDCDLVRWSKWSVWISSSAVSTLAKFRKSNHQKIFFLCQHLTFKVWVFCIAFSLWRRQNYHQRGTLKFRVNTTTKIMTFLAGFAYDTVVGNNDIWHNLPCKAAFQNTKTVFIDPSSYIPQCMNYSRGYISKPFSAYTQVC